MRKPLQALFCLGSLVALSAPVAAEAGTSQSAEDGCRVVAAKPYVDQQGMIRAAAARIGCADGALLRVRLREARRGRDHTRKSASARLSNGRVVASSRCSELPRRYYVLALDYRGHRERSAVVQLTCAPTAPQSSGTPTAPSGGTPSVPPPGGGEAVGTAVEREVVRLTNAARAQNGCRPLVHDPRLRAAAFGHSADMAARNYFDHTSPDGRSPGDRVKAAGFSPVTAWGENIAKGQPTAAAVMRAWLNSPGHKANIVNCAYTRIGVGQAARGPVWTQVFARK